MRKLVFLCLTLLLTEGCSRFSKQWETAAIERDGIAGTWDGTWKSDVNGHHGRLRCILSPRGQDRYDAFFKAHYLKILRFSYRMNMLATPGTPLKLEGEADLGKLAGGVYKYQGFASATNFFCTYSSKYDHGTFELKRPERSN